MLTVSLAPGLVAPRASHGRRFAGGGLYASLIGSSGP